MSVKHLQLRLEKRAKRIINNRRIRFSWTPIFRDIKRRCTFVFDMKLWLNDKYRVITSK